MAITNEYKSMTLTTLLFDLDDTLYPSECGLWTVLRERIGMYMQERMGIPAETVPTLRKELFIKYGTALRGLQATRQIDTPDFLAYVHNVPLANYLKPNPRLRQILAGLPQRKFIFTNADVPHAQRVIAALGLEGIFEKVIDIIAVSPDCKPMEGSYRIALQQAEVSDPASCAMIDDAPRNLATARRLGLFTILIAPQPAPEAHVNIPRLEDLPLALARYDECSGKNGHAV